MAGEINRVPAGLLSILDMKARGQSPRTLGDSIAGTVELLPLYLLQNRAWLYGSTPNIAAAGPYIVHNVPNDQYWHINRILVFHTTGLPAATEYILAVGMQRVAAGFTLQAPISAFSPRFLAGDRGGISFEGPIWAGPGDGFGVWCVDAVLGTAIAFAVVIDYTIVPI